MAPQGVDPSCAPSVELRSERLHKADSHVSDDASLMAAHRSAPQPDPACLYGLIGDVARAGSDGTETNPYAIAANFMAYLACAMGRNPYLPIGNTWHHARLFVLHIGRSGRGRKGDALSLVLRIDQALRALSDSHAPQIHRGGLSSREGLVALIHDGYKQGRQVVEPMVDKRLWVVESEFANVLHQGRRDGNTLSAALRDCWDGVSMKPATKSNRLYASDPHVCLSGAISPGELLTLMKTRELTNGFANRFLMIWAERSQVLPFPRATAQATVDEIARRVLVVLEFVGADNHGKGDGLRMELSPQAQWRYGQLYRAELNEECGSSVLVALLERRAPMLLRLAMLFALTDSQLRIDVQHIEAAAAWTRHAVASVRFVFVSADESARMARVEEMAAQILEFLKQHGSASRRDITVECFDRHGTKQQIDAAVEYLMGMTPARIQVRIVDRPKNSPGTPITIYQMV
jgi:putative DNA primase/helicase